MSEEFSGPNEQRTGLSRRDVLKRGGAVAATGAVGLGATTAVASSHLPGSTTVDLGDEGLSPGDDIQPMVDDHLADGVNVLIPGDDDDPVRYEFNDDVRGTYENAALVGDGMVELVRSDGVSRSISINAGSGEFVLGKIISRGRQGGEDVKFRAWAGGGGTMTVQEVHQPDGAEGTSSGDPASGWLVRPEHSGTLRFCECSVEGFPDNGFYASAPGHGANGRVILTGCKAKNCNISGIRIGSDDSEINDCVIVNDAQAPPADGSTVMRGLRIRQPGTGISISNLHIEYTYTGTGATEPIEVDDGAAGGQATASGVTIRNDTDSQAIVVEENYDLSGSDLDLTGSGNLGYDGSFTDVCTGSGCETPQSEAIETDCGPLTDPDDGSGGGGGGGGGSGPGVIEDFEGSDPLAEYGARDHLFGVTTSTVYEGGQALINDSGSYGSLVSTSGLDRYPSRGDRVRYYFDNAGDDNFVAFHLFAQSETNRPEGYAIGISNTGAWRMWRNDGDDAPVIANQDLPASEQIDGWYRAEVWTDDTTVYADLYDDSTDTLLASIQADDTTYSSGGIGFRSAGNGEVWDYAIRGDDSAPPVVEDFERSNPLVEYGARDDLFGVTTSTVYGGERALVNDSGSYGSLVSTSGLGEYPDRGDRIEYYFNNASDDNFVAFHLFAQSETNRPEGYAIGISNAGAWRMWRNDGDDAPVIANQDLPASDQISGWYRAEVWTDSTTVYADLYDDSNDNLLASIQADDTTYSSGGIGFRSTGNGEVWDYVVRDVVEDFERSDPLADYGGADGLYGVTTSTVYEGDQALINDSGSYGSTISTTGLGEYPERGDEVTYYFNNATDDNFVAFHLFAQSEQDRPDSYSIGISNTGAWRMWRVQNDDNTIIADQDLPTSDQIDGWYRAEISTDDTTVYADLYDDSTDTLLASIQADDTTYSSGGIGFRSAGNGEVWDFVQR